MSSFLTMKNAVNHQIQKMQKHSVFRVDISKDSLWDTYLQSFPEGTNPIYRERTEHDCNCCRSFIRQIGDMVAIIDGQIVSIWDINIGGTYQVVADALAKLVKSKPIQNVFLSTEQSIGTDKNRETNDFGTTIKTWEHFHTKLASTLVCTGNDIGPRLSESRSTFDVFYRGLTSITPLAVDTVLELIEQNSLYRGAEAKFQITEFKKVQTKFDALKTNDEHIAFAWEQSGKLAQSVTRLRNTLIGTLLVELSEGVDIEDAVRKYEVQAAPANYKRPNPIVTKAQIDKMKNAIQEAGYMSALDRRYAQLSDITANNTLYVNRDVKSMLGDGDGDIFDELTSTIADNSKKYDKVEEVNIEKFISDILPKATSIEVMVENRHVNNLVSLIAPVDPTAKNMFKWDNPFSWSYNGDFADSIKERVKKAGGNVTGDLCCRLAWYNYDDLDFHMIEPTGHEIYFGNRGSKSSCGGMLDVDMNAGRGTTREPVENIVYNNVSTMKEGTYTLKVHQFAKRESDNVGFEVDIDMMGQRFKFVYPKPVRDKEYVTVATFKYSKVNGLTLVNSLPEANISKVVWNLNTETFNKVNIMMLSPNHWDDQGVGNKHYFFMIDKCINDGDARGFYNEFLKEELTPHRKGMELLGSKKRTAGSVNQLSGLGFSSTVRNNVLVRVHGSFTRVIKVTF